jgi:hypothetical protein
VTSGTTAISSTSFGTPAMTLGEQDNIRDQVCPYWNAPVGAKDAEHLMVTLHLKLAQDGSVLEVQLSQDQGRYASDSFFAAAADAAIRAVKRASPLKNLPADKFGTWNDMELTFNPSDM